MATELPTIEECRAFMDAINAGRQALGLPVIQKLEYDSCWPDGARRCLSAHHLFHPDDAPQIDGCVLDLTVANLTPAQSQALSQALNTSTRGTMGYPELVIPPVIKAVTDPFDGGEQDPDLFRALRDRLVEAELVA